MMRSVLSDLEICVVHGRPVTVGPISRGSVSLLFALIKGEPSELASDRGDSTGEGALDAAALRTHTSTTPHSHTHRPCERSGPASSGRRRRGHTFTRAAAGGR